MQNFFSEDPLPAESIRLKKLIADQLDCLRFVDEELKGICRKATLGLMDGGQSMHVEEFVTALSQWEHDVEVEQEVDVEESQPVARKAMKVMSWLGI